jgi:hypothetical protein
LAAIDSASGRPLYLAFIHHERVSDYLEAISSIEKCGYTINGIIIDGLRSLFTELDGRYNLQMCQFHMMQIIRRYLTLKPKLRGRKGRWRTPTNSSGNTYPNQ